jgi:hypothetical protein
VKVILISGIRDKQMKKKNKKNDSRKSQKLKDLYLDRPTSHGGWPGGHPGGFTDRERPVNVQIADYLEAMGLLEAPSHAVLSEQNLRSLIRKILIEVHS